MKMYIAVLDEFPDYMTPTLVAHAVLGAHLYFTDGNCMGDALLHYENWLKTSFKKCVVRVNQKEFNKISNLPHVYLGHENNTLGGKKSCAVVCPRTELPNVLKFAKLWKPTITNGTTTTLMEGSKMDLSKATSEEVSAYKEKWEPGYVVQLASNMDVKGKDWCRRHLERWQWGMIAFADANHHEFMFEHEPDAIKFAEDFSSVVADKTTKTT